MKFQKKSLSYVDDTLNFLQRQKRKYCEVIETTPIEEIPPLVYINKKKKRQLSAVEEHDAELYEVTQRFKKHQTKQDQLEEMLRKRTS